MNPGCNPLFRTSDSTFPKRMLLPRPISMLVTYTHLIFLIPTHIFHLASSAQIQLKKSPPQLCWGPPLELQRLQLPLPFSLTTFCLHSSVQTCFSTWYKSSPRTANLRQWMRPDIPRFGQGSTSNNISPSSPSQEPPLILQSNLVTSTMFSL